ncbi:HAD family hydrolase [Nocardioides sp.]|uniref:HAD family hydrolase n=1 Tax=Nocardioides sp. TaxID=35761 RepID=UPI00356889E0
MRAVLWDLDGTLVDTEPYWIDTEFALAAEHGATWSREHALNLVGNDLIQSGHYIRDVMNLEMSAEEVVDYLNDGVVAAVKAEVPWRPGALDLLAALAEAEVPCGLVTMSYQRFVAPILGRLAADTFRVVVTGDQVEHGKPHPEPYLTAAAALGFAPRDCVAIEDSNTGAASAVGAGCSVLVVENHVRVDAGPGRTFVDSLADVDVAALRGLVAAQ